jgi:phosphatidylserine decarboxylase
MRSLLRALAGNERINFLLTNRIPRYFATRFIGWFSRIEQPLIRDLSIAAWKTFSDLELDDAGQSKFKSMHDCFVRELKPNARPIDRRPRIVVSPCDALVGACGRVDGTTLVQAKGAPYSLLDLFGEAELVERYRDGVFVTLRLTAGMYHRFHAPYDARLRRINYIAGDTWNVNPIALKRIEKLFCKNERALIDTELVPGGHALALVPVAAILVASLRLHCLPRPLDLRYRGPNRFDVDRAVAKGEELGWFEHGSTIIVFAQRGVSIVEAIAEGSRVRMGQALFELPADGTDGDLCKRA